MRPLFWCPGVRSWFVLSCLSATAIGFSCSLSSGRPAAAGVLRRIGTETYSRDDSPVPGGVSALPVGCRAHAGQMIERFLAVGESGLGAFGSNRVLPGASALLCKRYPEDWPLNRADVVLSIIQMRLMPNRALKIPPRGQA